MAKATLVTLLTPLSTGNIGQEIMLTKTQINRRYCCPCMEEGVKCNFHCRYRFTLQKHIIHEHRFEPEGKFLLEQKRKKAHVHYLKQKKKKEILSQFYRIERR